MLSVFRRQQGFSLIEVVIVSAVMLVFFSGLLTAVKYSMDLTTNARARLSALTLAHERIEYIRSLSYDAVGTVSGIPSGAIPQYSTSTLNNMKFYERVLVQYVDDDADGLGAADSNDILADYKVVKVEYSWNLTGATSSVELISYVVPRSIETTAGGGTIRVNVFDAYAAPLSGASVRLLNTTTTSTIDVTRSTDATGVALFAGAPAASNYQIFVTDTGYSMDQTYVATTSNPNPITPPISVLEADVSTMNFQIDRLSNLALTTYSAITENASNETFASSSALASSSRTTVTSGELRLTQTTGVYAASGVAYLSVVTPSPLERWENISLVPTLPLTTNYVVRLYTGTTSAYTLVPDSDLPGNAAGFSTKRINLGSLSASTYPSLVVGVTLTTGNTSVTPAIADLSLYYRQSSTKRASVGYTLRGAKLKSIDPIYKTVLSGTTNGTGAATHNNIEWDTYTLTLSGYTQAAVCPGNPFVLLPNVTLALEALTVTPSTNNLRVQVLDSADDPISGAYVNISRSGVNLSGLTGACGQVFFSSGTISAAADYTLTVGAGGRATSTITGVAITGDTTQEVTLTP